MIGDTIFAVASPPGAGERGVLRISGPRARPAAARVLGGEPPARRGAYEAQARVLGFPVPCLVLSMPAPASYTGEDVVELHLPGSPMLLDLVGQELAVEPDSRQATPGEFTRRAFENRKLDLAESEAVLGLIHAQDAEDRRFALSVLAGGLGRSVDRLRQQLQDARALIEAGLDFTDGETGAVPRRAWLPGLEQVQVELRALQAGLPESGVRGEVLVLGAANAGKSSLCNALVGQDRALVSELAGTTRDVLAFELAGSAGRVRLLDGPGDLPAAGDIDAAALALRDRLATRASAALLVVDGTAPVVPETTLPVLATVLTKLDLPSKAPVPDRLPAPVFRVSSTSGQGVEDLRRFLEQQSAASPAAFGRVGEALAGAVAALAAGIAGARAGQPEELVALELASVAERLDEVHGRSSPEDLLDRIFAGFCLGK